MDYRTKVAAEWWTNALREKVRNGEGSQSTLEEPEAETLTEQQFEAFEAALAREINCMLTQDLTHVLTVNHRWSAPQFSTAAASCGIDDITGKLPSDTVMRIFPNTVMAHIGAHSQVEILWTNNKALSCSTKDRLSA